MSEVPEASQSNSSDYFEHENSQFLKTLQDTVLPGDAQPSSLKVKLRPSQTVPSKRTRDTFDETVNLSDSSVRAAQSLDGDDEDTYGASRFGEYGEYMRRKRAKLQIQNSAIESETASTSKSQLFKGLSIYINGWTKPSVQDLRQIILQHGGVFQPYLVKKSLVTHILTCSLTPAKIREFQHMKVVRPEWLTESIECGSLLPWKDFQFIPEDKPDTVQGSKIRQKTLLDSQPSPSQVPGSAFMSKLPSESKPTSSVESSEKEMSTSDIPQYAASTSNVLAQRAMESPDWRKAHTSAAPDFIEGFYKNSRLHHLSTWKSELKDLVQEAQERADAGVHDAFDHADSHEPKGVSMRGAELLMRSPKSKWKGKGRAIEDQEQVIMHCDFDCFFVSAGLVSRPHLKGKPVVVCHSQGKQGGTESTSEIASSSYEARNFGIRNGMSLQQARKLCPSIITIPYEFEQYKKLSLEFYTILLSHADDLQAVSVDEAILEVTTTVNYLRSHNASEEPTSDPAKDFAESIRAQIRRITGCEGNVIRGPQELADLPNMVVSIGISHNILLARIATKGAKPAGSYHLTKDKIQEVLAPLDIADLHGFGWSTKQKALEKLGVTTLGELAGKSKGMLCDALGKASGEKLYNAIRGIDEKKLESDKPRKSVSCEINYGIRFEKEEEAESFIAKLSSEVKHRLDAIGMVGRSITLKIMKRDPAAPQEPAKFLGHGPCNTFNKQMPLLGPGGRPTSDDLVIKDHAWKMLKSFNFDPKELRGIGLQIQRLESSSGETSNADAGQAVLPFRRVHTGEPGPSTSAWGTVDTGNNQAEAAVRTDDPREQSITIDLPSFSQVDRSVFDALPYDVREELEQEYKRRSASPFIANNEPISKAPLNRKPVFPQKNGAQKGTYNHITRQLAPRGRSSISPKKSLLYNIPKSVKPSVKISEAELQKYDIDPEVFAMLPIKVQREQLVRARLIQQRGSLPDTPTQRKIIKPRKLLPGRNLWRAPAPKARYHQPPFLRQQGKNNKERLHFTETDDIQQVVEKWVTGYRHWAPKEKDVEYFAKYLVRSVDGASVGDAGVERAIAILKWWLVLLRRFWPSHENTDTCESQENAVAFAWWKAFRGVKDQMDAVARKRFGGRLSLK